MTWRVRLYLVFVALCALALAWPGYAWLGNRFEPRFAGLPLSFAWNIGWVLASFGALVVFHVTRPAGDDDEDDDDHEARDGGGA